MSDRQALDCGDFVSQSGVILASAKLADLQRSQRR